MNFESLIGDYVRQYQFRKLVFPEGAGATPLPAADEGRCYLLYLHVPYCAVLCPFCSFHRVRYQAASAGNYFAALRREIALATDAGYRFDELYVGGGTPTIAPRELTETIASVRARHSLTGISVETNPDDLGGEPVSGLIDAGVNRLSVGVQSFDDELLGRMHRLERYGSGEEIVRRLQKVMGRFDTLNVDMMFNIPRQSEKSLRRDLTMLTDEASVDQVSYYPLMTVNSVRSKMHEAMGEVDYGRERAFYELLSDHMLSKGYTRTSAWCFSRKPGMFDEYIVEREEYLGLGSGAFSYLQGSLYASTFSIGHYERLVASGATGTFGRLDLSERDRMRYYLLLRLFSGTLDRRDAEARFDGRFQRTLWPELTLLKTVGAVTSSGVQLALTRRGYYLWVMLMREFFTGVNNLRDQMRRRLPVAAAT